MIRHRKLPTLKAPKPRPGPAKAGVLSVAGGAPSRGLCESAGTPTIPIREGAPHDQQ